MNNGLLVYEASMVYALASLLRDRSRVVNIGGGFGASTVAILKGTKELKDFHMWSIDIVVCEDEAHNVRRLGMESKFEQIIAPSIEVGKTWGNGMIDMLVVDGSHRYEDVLGDLNAWTPHVKEGGFVCCHDYKDERQVQVTKAINEWRKNTHRYYYKLGTMLFMVAFLKKGEDTEWTFNRIELPWAKSSLRV